MLFYNDILAIVKCGKSPTGFVLLVPSQWCSYGRLWWIRIIMAGLGDYKPIPLPGKSLHDSTAVDRIPVITPSLTMKDCVPSNCVPS